MKKTDGDPVKKSIARRLRKLQTREDALEKKWQKVSRRRTSGEDRKAKNALDLELLKRKIERRKFEKAI
ncbi:MAG: hypothetical protein ACPG32_04375 [Akkermansiaceae bacterium]